jgi:hypothetical protein
VKIQNGGPKNAIREAILSSVGFSLRHKSLEAMRMRDEETLAALI